MGFLFKLAKNTIPSFFILISLVGGFYLCEIDLYTIIKNKEASSWFHGLALAAVYVSIYVFWWLFKETTIFFQTLFNEKKKKMLVSGKGESNLGNKWIFILIKNIIFFRWRMIYKRIFFGNKTKASLVAEFYEIISSITATIYLITCCFLWTFSFKFGYYFLFLYIGIIFLYLFIAPIVEIIIFKILLVRSKFDSFGDLKSLKEEKDDEERKGRVLNLRNEQRRRYINYIISRDPKVSRSDLGKLKFSQLVSAYETQKRKQTATSAIPSPKTLRDMYIDNIISRTNFYTNKELNEMTLDDLSDLHRKFKNLQKK